MAQMVSHFRHFLKEMASMSHRINDPFSECCYEYLRKYCLVIFNMA
jgi:hypothetical protein